MAGAVCCEAGGQLLVNLHSLLAQLRTPDLPALQAARLALSRAAAAAAEAGPRRRLPHLCPHAGYGPAGVRAPTPHAAGGCGSWCRGRCCTRGAGPAGCGWRRGADSGAAVLP